MSASVVLVTGCFSVLHPGHLRLFRFAKECGDRLIVGVLSDRMVSALVSERLRLEGIQSNMLVDEAFLLDEPVEQAILKLKPDVVLKGKEHESRFNPERLAVEQYGGKLLFSSGEIAFSSVDLIRSEFLDSNLRLIKFQDDYLRRHSVEIGKLAELLKRFSKLKICVVGDLIVDEYITCQALGMSQEDPTIVVTPIDQTCFIGGAGIVAAHAAGLGAAVKFISVTGDDDAQKFAQTALKKALVDASLLVDESRPTTLKQRIRSQGKSLLRISYLHQGAISLDLQESIFQEFKNVILDADLVVFSDFNYGCLPQSLVDRLMEAAKSKSLKIAADSQSSSQMGDISRFKDADLITPTEREARISTRNNEDGLVVLAEQLRRKCSARNILLKLGEEGLLVYANNITSESWLTDRVGALNRAPKDVAGAGDSLLVTAAMAIAAGGSIWEAACLGSLAAAIQVGRVGNTPIKTQELLRELL